MKEEIRQKIKAKTGKTTRYKQRINHYQQNRLLEIMKAEFISS